MSSPTHTPQCANGPMTATSRSGDTPITFGGGGEAPAARSRMTSSGRNESTSPARRRPDSTTTTTAEWSTSTTPASTTTTSVPAVSTTTFTPPRAQVRRRRAARPCRPRGPVRPTRPHSWRSSAPFSCGAGEDRPQTMRAIVTSTIVAPIDAVRLMLYVSGADDSVATRPGATGRMSANPRRKRRTSTGGTPPSRGPADSSEQRRHPHGPGRLSVNRTLGRPSVRERRGIARPAVS